MPADLCADAPERTHPQPRFHVRFEYWRSAIDRRWYWHLKNAQNEKLAQGEPYGTKAECLRAIEQVRAASAAPLFNLSPHDP